MTILGVIQTEEPIAVDEVRSILEERLLAYPRFSMRFARSRFGRLILESDPNFDISFHVRTIPNPGSEARLLETLGGLAGSILPEGRAPWEVLVVENYEGGTLIIPRLHHSLADGIALIQVLVSLCDDAPEHRPPLTADATGRQGIVSRWLRVLTEAVRLALLPSDPPTSIKAPLSGVKNTAWSLPVSTTALRAAAAERGVTINDLVTAAISGALSAVLAERSEAEIDTLRAMVPFNLRNAEVGQPLGNRFGLVLPELPVGDLDSGARLRQVNRTMANLKSSAQGAAAYFVLNVMGFSARVVESLLVRFFGRKSSLVMTNVPGPSEPLSFGGRSISKLLFWVPQAGGIAVGVSVISYGGELTVGVLADDASLPDPMLLIEAYEKELAAYGVPA